MILDIETTLYLIACFILGAVTLLVFLYNMLGTFIINVILSKTKKDKWLLLEDNPNGLLMDKLATYDSSGKWKTDTQVFTATSQVFRLRCGSKIALVANDSVFSQSPTFARVLEVLKQMGVPREDINTNTGLRAITTYLDEVADPEKEKIMTDKAVMAALLKKNDIVTQIYQLLPIGMLLIFAAIAYAIISQNPGTVASVTKGIIPI